MEPLKQQTVEYATDCLRSTYVGNLNPLKIQCRYVKEDDNIRRSVFIKTGHLVPFI